MGRAEHAEGLRRCRRHVPRVERRQPRSAVRADHAGVGEARRLSEPGQAARVGERGRQGVRCSRWSRGRAGQQRRGLPFQAGDGPVPGRGRHRRYLPVRRADRVDWGVRAAALHSVSHRQRRVLLPRIACLSQYGADSLHARRVAISCSFGLLTRGPRLRPPCRPATRARQSAILSRMRAHTRRFVNWARTCSSMPAARAQPASEDAVAELVRAAARGARVKVVGAGHSWSDIACTDGMLLSLDRLDRVLEVHEDQREVTLEARIPLRALNAALAERGLALPVLGSIAEQSVAGAISTATHGSAPRLPNLAGLVTRLRMVLADASVVDLSADPDPELFAAARVGLGALGVITRVTLRCVPAFRLEEICEPMRFDEALDKVPDLAAREEFVKLCWLPHTDSVQVFRYRRTDAPSRFRRSARWVDEAIANRGVFALLPLS